MLIWHLKRWQCDPSSADKHLTVISVMRRLWSWFGLEQRTDAIRQWLQIWMFSLRWKIKPMVLHNYLFCCCCYKKFGQCCFYATELLLYGIIIIRKRFENQSKDSWSELMINFAHTRDLIDFNIKFVCN